MKGRTLLLSSLALMAALSSCRGPSEPEITQPYSDPNDNKTTAVVTNLVQIETGGTMATDGGWVKTYLSVTDQQGIPLENLNHFNFSAAESADGAWKQVSSEELTAKTVAETGLPTASCLVMDYSRHMPDSLKSGMESGAKLFILLMGSEDAAEIIKFSDYPFVAQTFTSNKDVLTAAVEAAWGGAGGGSALIDAVYQGLLDAGPVEGLRAVYTLTVGWENASQRTIYDLFDLAHATGIPCYTFGLGEGDTSKIKEIADFTGGRFFYVPGLEEPEKMFELLSGMLKKSYLLQWDVKSSSGSEVTASITTEYTCANGTLKSTATGVFTAP